MRTAVEWRSSSKSNYEDFCKKHPSIKLTYDEWKNVIYTFSEKFKEYILETGEKAKLPLGLGEFSIVKKKRKKIKKDKDGREFINLPVDWKKTREKGKIIYNFNYDTEGYFFGWVWFKRSTRIRHWNSIVIFHRFACSNAIGHTGIRYFQRPANKHWSEH